MRTPLALASAYLLCFSSSAVIAAPTLDDAATAVASAAAPASTACGDIVNSPDMTFTATDILNCLTSIPFNGAIATNLITYLKDTFEFQSTLAYLKSPPPSYQQGAVDLLKGLDSIQENINNGVYANQYAFEADLQLLYQSAHDSHLYILAGVLAVFSFYTENEIVSVSSDGIELPKLYLQDHMQNQVDGLGQASEIVSINGEDPTEYLSNFAAQQSFGTVEPHADWNQLMYSPALDIQGYNSVLGGAATFYPGDTLTYTLANGTVVSDPWRGLYWSPGYTGPLSTGGDFYNFFVLGILPASYNFTYADSTDDSDNGDDDSDSPIDNDIFTWNNITDAYPSNPVIIQTDLGITGGGFITGYFLEDTKVAVLSIPSFDEYSDSVDTFQNAVQVFLEKAKAAGMEKVVIDVLQNDGGDTFLAIDTFKRFFPSIQPFAGSRMRAQSMANIIGNQVTDYFQGLTVDSYYYDTLAIDEWVVTDRLDEDGHNITSWAEYYGPKEYHGDSFTNIQRYNLSSFIFDVEALNDANNTAVYGYADDPATTGQPFAASDIIILTDGLCHSACALFMELMHHEAGVRSVVVGGKPTYGPMQAPAGTRGAADYPVDTLDSYISWVQEQNATANTTLPQREEDIWISASTFNLRDQMRRDDTTPLQFAYEAADCRIFFTPETILNMKNLWQYAANAIWTNPSLCVQNSTGYATPKGKTDTVGPKADFGAAYKNMSLALPGLQNKNDRLPEAITGAIDDVGEALTIKGSSKAGSTCSKRDVGHQGSCGPTETCAMIHGCPNGAKKPVSIPQCVATCQTGRLGCGAGANCNLTTRISSNPPAYSGFCEPQSSKNLVQVKFCPVGSPHNAPPPPEAGLKLRRR